MKRRELSSVAHGLAESFVSRNNDVDGWWAPGLLLQTLPSDNRRLVIDLLSGRAVPDLAGSSSGLRHLPETWSGYLRSHIDRQHVRHRVTNAVMTVRFDPLPGSGRPTQFHFSCAVTIEDDRGRQFEGSAVSQASAHDDHRELRSGGPNRLFEEYGGVGGRGALDLTPSGATASSAEDFDDLVE